MSKVKIIAGSIALFFVAVFLMLVAWTERKKVKPEAGSDEQLAKARKAKAKKKKERELEAELETEILNEEQNGKEIEGTEGQSE